MIEEKKGFNVLSAFFNEARKEGRVVEVTMNSGVEFKGVITSFDNTAFILLDPTLTGPSLIFKHAVASMI